MGVVVRFRDSLAGSPTSWVSPCVSLSQNPLSSKADLAGFCASVLAGGVGHRASRFVVIKLIHHHQVDSSSSSLSSMAVGPPHHDVVRYTGIGWGAVSWIERTKK